jgi:threonine dehydrogenase-like Zn-dependent dehydrogenase
MKILQVTKPKEFTILDLPVPRPGPGEVLLRIEGVTTCPQWDLHLRHNEPMFIGHRFHYPYTAGQPGHEAAGVVEFVGAGVVGLAPGDRISAWRDPGHEVPGCYAQFVVHRQENLIRVPDGLPVEALAPVELAMCVATVFRSLEKMDAVRGRAIGVAGLGPAGLVALQMALAAGANAVFGIDLNPKRRQLALRLGARACFDPRGEEFGGEAWPEDLRVQSSIDCVGAKSSVEYLMDRTQDVLGLFGVQRENYTYAPRHNMLTICGYKGHSRESAKYAVELIRKGHLKLAPLVSHRLPLERYGEGIDLLERQEATKVCFLPWEA